MRDRYHADISNGFNVRVYSTEPPEDLVVRLGHFLYPYILMYLVIKTKKRSLRAYSSFFFTFYLDIDYCNFF